GVMQVNSTSNGYTGLTTINAGILQVNGTVGNVRLNGGTLGGVGSVGPLTVDPTNGGTVSPAGPPRALVGTLTDSGTVTFNDKTTFFVNLNSASSYDQLNVIGTPGTIDLGLANLAGLVGPGVNINDTFTIIHAAGGITGIFAQGDKVF